MCRRRRRRCDHPGLRALDHGRAAAGDDRPGRRLPAPGALKVGSRVVYTSAADPTRGVLDSDLVIDGPGHNTAFGHVVLDLATLSGVVRFSGGTGVFTHFHAGPLVVACPAFPDCSWDGPYSVSPPN